MIGSSDIRPFRNFQIRWKECLGYQDCPYLIRWSIIFFGRSIRVHHWLRSDDRRHFHDHSSNLLSIVFSGKYINVTPEGKTHVQGFFNTPIWKWKKCIWYSKATQRHYLDIPKEGAWTILFEGKKYHKWGFYVNGHKWRSLRYFHKFGIIQTKNYQ